VTTTLPTHGFGREIRRARSAAEIAIRIASKSFTIESLSFVERHAGSTNEGSRTAYETRDTTVFLLPSGL